MNGPVFLSVELTFGRHAGRHELGFGGPVLIAGPNGSGKTTLLDALLRTIYGFRRRSADDRDLSAAREPWDDDTYRCEVRLRTAGGDLLSWSRDHRSDEVRVVREDDDEVLFSGVANPGSSAASDRPYWDLVERTFGLRRLDDYAKTAWIGQGAVLETSFGSDLLRLAEGGHARLQAALKRIETRYRRITREPISADARRGPVDRRLERDRQALDEIRRRLGEARNARAEHERMESRLAAVDAEATDLDAEIDRLESARAALAERRRLDAEADAAEQRLDHLVELRETLEVARREVRDAENAYEAHAEFEAYPPEFPTIADRFEAAWEEEERLGRTADALEGDLAALAPDRAERLLPAAVIVGIGLVLAIGVLRPSAGAAVAGWAGVLSLSLFAAVGLWRAAERRGARRSTHRQLAEVRRLREATAARLRGLHDELPAAVARGFSPATLAGRRSGFARARAARARREEARGRYRDTLRRVEESAEARATPGRTLPLLISDAERRLAEIRLQRERLDPVSSPPGDDLPLTVRGLDERLRDGRQRRASLQREREDFRIQLDRAARRLSEAARLERENAELTRRVEEAEESAEALRAARALLRDGYEEFRDHDEARLVEAVSQRISRLGRPALGPFRAESGLGAPAVRFADRWLAVDSPALSHGQRRLVMLAVRLGVADFLADGGPAAPLVVDEPFAHLDDEHARQLWNLLRDIAVHRQVVITTQESELLDRLGARPSIRLARDDERPLVEGGEERRAGA